jgi:hypothetical protein
MKIINKKMPFEQYRLKRNLDSPKGIFAFGGLGNGSNWDSACKQVASAEKVLDEAGINFACAGDDYNTIDLYVPSSQYTEARKILIERGLGHGICS